MNQLIGPDLSATEIGQLFERARCTHLDSVRFLIEAGNALRIKRAALEHGRWLGWLAENEIALGFGERTARRLITAAESNRTLTSDMAPEAAAELNRRIWGNLNSAAPKERLPVARTDPPSLPTETDFLLAALNVLLAFTAKDPTEEATLIDTHRTQEPLERAHCWIGEVLEAL